MGNLENLLKVVIVVVVEEVARIIANELKRR